MLHKPKHSSLSPSAMRENTAHPVRAQTCGKGSLGNGRPHYSRHSPQASHIPSSPVSCRASSHLGLIRNKPKISCLRCAQMLPLAQEGSLRARLPLTCSPKVKQCSGHTLIPQKSPDGEAALTCVRKPACRPSAGLSLFLINRMPL